MERCDGVGGHALPHHRHEHAVRVERGEKPPLDHGVEVVEPVGPGQDLSDRIHVQGGGERYRVGAGSALVQKTEADPCHARKLLVVARLDPLLADEIEVREHRGDDVVGVRKPHLGGLDRDAERREIRVPNARPCAQPFRPAARLQRREQAAAAFVAEEVRDQNKRVCPVMRA